MNTMSHFTYDPANPTQNFSRANEHVVKRIRIVQNRQPRPLDLGLTGSRREFLIWILPEGRHFGVFAGQPRAELQAILSLSSLKEAMLKRTDLLLPIERYCPETPPCFFHFSISIR